MTTKTLTIKNIHTTLLAEINNRTEQARNEYRLDIKQWLLDQAETLADSFRVLTDGEPDPFTRTQNMKMHAELTAAAAGLGE